MCDVVVRLRHSGKSLAGNVDPQLSPNRVQLIKLTSVCFGYGLFQKEAHR